MPPTTETLTYDAVLSSTMRARSPGYVDQVEKQLPLFWWLRKKGQYKKAEGDAIEWQVRYRINQADGSFQGFDPAGIVDRSDFTRAKASWKQYRTEVVMSGLDGRVKNVGNARIFNLMQAKENAALASMQEDMGEDFYLDGTGNDSKNVTGLSAIMPEDPTTGTLFNIDRSTAGNEFWRSQIKDHGGGAAWSSGVLTMQRGMRQLKTLCGRVKMGGKGMRYPDVAFCTEGYLRNYEDMLSSGVGQRFVNTEAASAGFTNLTYQGMTIIEDQDCPLDAESEDQAYFVNSDFIELRYAPADNFRVSDPIQAINQDAKVIWLTWAGELIATQCNKQGLHYGIAVLA